jgi:hypothetical protein
MKIISKRFLVLTILFILLINGIKLQAQNEADLKPLSERIENVTNKLQLKLLLSKEQQIKINAILVESIPNPIVKENREKTLELINTKIETVLTKKQKTKFSILKSKWLDELIGGTE